MAAFFGTFHNMKPQRLLSPPVSLTTAACLLFDIQSEGQYYTMSVGTYQENGTVERIVDVSENEVVRGVPLQVALPEGDFRILFEVLGRMASVYLDDVNIFLGLECASSGTSPCLSVFSNPFDICTFFEPLENNNKHCGW